MTKNDAETLALSALAELLDNDILRDRFIALSGMTPDDLRRTLGDASARPTTCLAILDFFMQSEPDLVVLAELLEDRPEKIVAAWRALGGSEAMA